MNVPQGEEGKKAKFRLAVGSQMFEVKSRFDVTVFLVLAIVAIGLGPLIFFPLAEKDRRALIQTSLKSFPS
ncbi:unnamed protein product [Musa acuminata subsp. malaccensis]|uniref:(wild Malaysian banana) hypothetical protein n=1 Tax=Musa acuminata subsp. malaccensis TaxID=214687 RepID=A0A804K9P6_MUSAM|nr:unnamed protein product [Musa acuminata subsp. malaccensis]